MTAAKIADLKNHLSAYLQEVRRGGEVVIMDRNHPIARIVPFSSRRHDDFVIRPARGKPSDLLKIKPVKLSHPIKFEEVLKMLREDRDAR